MVGDLEDEVARALVADAQLVLAAEAVEDRKADAQQRDASRSAAWRPWLWVARRSAPGQRLEIAEIADLTVSPGTCSRILRASFVVTAARISAPMPTKKVASAIEKIGLGGDGDPLAGEVEMPVEQRVLQLRALAGGSGPGPGRPESSPSIDDEAVDGFQPAELANSAYVDAGQFVQSSAGARMCSPMAMVGAPRRGCGCSRSRCRRRSSRSSAVARFRRATGNVGQDDGLEPEGRDHIARCVDVGERQVRAGQDIDAPGRFGVATVAGRATLGSSP